ncbi:hypothetical protein Dsin_030795 [Dipteronia sinensis]|uniref:DUF659 domain-containing protein n=1 Tax=Dipteronia sinensis TaxID=43782 RepID=A0AAD9ZLQ6_9ROSI|nr:hypothetical protein Dsin_030795 [Dipteronia sinensis]
MPKNKKKSKKNKEDEIRVEVNIDGKNEEDEMEELWSMKKPNVLGHIDNFTSVINLRSSNKSYDEAYSHEHIFEYVLKAIEQVVSENVVQVVTNNTSNNIVVAKMLKEKIPNVFWTSCATHTINLMLLIKTFTRKKDIKKDKLGQMFTSTEWKECKWSKTDKGKTAYTTVMSIGFWNGVNLSLKVFAPFVKILPLFDGHQKPSIGFLYGELKQAKEKIREVLKNNESSYRPIFAIIVKKSKDLLDSPLHSTTYVLNPLYIFNYPSIYNDVVSDGFCNFTELYFPDDLDMQNLVMNIEFVKYMRKEGPFGKPLARKGCDKNNKHYNPDNFEFSDDEVEENEVEFESDVDNGLEDMEEKTNNLET